MHRGGGGCKIWGARGKDSPLISREASHCHSLINYLIAELTRQGQCKSLTVLQCRDRDAHLVQQVLRHEDADGGDAVSVGAFDADNAQLVHLRAQPLACLEDVVDSAGEEGGQLGEISV